jgi:hypothetical protein
MSKKLEQVLEHLIAGDQAKAKELLHSVFIEKARKIHEEMMSQDDSDEFEHMGGDEGENLEGDLNSHSDHIGNMSDEIDAEETMGEQDGLDAEDSMDDVGMDDDMGGDDLGSDVDAECLDAIEDTIGDLEAALAELKAEFDKIESDNAGDEAGEGDEEFAADDEEAAADDEEFAADDEEAAADDEEAAADDEVASDDDEEVVDESWLEEEFDDLAEAIELDKVSIPTGGEVGAGKFSSDVGTCVKSVVPSSQTSRMGAKPVSVDSKNHSGYNKETAPSAKEMGLENRRKKADAGMSKVSKEGNSSAMINKTASEFGADTVGKNSILTKAPRK